MGQPLHILSHPMPIPQLLQCKETTLAGDHLTEWWTSTVRQLSWLWYQGEALSNGLPAEFNEDASTTLVDFSSHPNWRAGDEIFSYSDVDIDTISDLLGIPWEGSKTVPFTEIATYLGFEWNIAAQTVSIPLSKKEKYKSAMRFGRHRHFIPWKKLKGYMGNYYMPATIIPAGHTYLISLHTILLNTQLQTSIGGSTSSVQPAYHVPSQALRQSQIERPSQMHVQVLASALLSATNGELGGLSQDGNHRAEILAGQRQWALNSWPKLSVPAALQVNISRFSETIKGSLKVGGPC